MADSSRHDLFQVAEATYGTTPDTDPAFKDVRHTSTSLTLSKESFTSEELNSDRQITTFRHGVKTVGGDIGFELSYGSQDDFLEAALGGTWESNVLTAGTTRRSFSLLRQFTDLSPAEKPFHLFSGCEISSMNLTVPASGIVTGSFGVFGKSVTISEGLVSLGTPTYSTPTTTAPFDSFTGTIEEGGDSIGIVTEIALTLENSITAKHVIGSDETLQGQIGRSNLTGTVTAFFENATLMEKFINETSSSLKFTLSNGANSYEINIPKIIYNGASPDVSGEGAITIALPFQAVYDDAEATNIKITRA